MFSFETSTVYATWNWNTLAVIGSDNFLLFFGSNSSHFLGWARMRLPSGLGKNWARNLLTQPTPSHIAKGQECQRNSLLFLGNAIQSSTCVKDSAFCTCMLYREGISVKTKGVWINKCNHTFSFKIRQHQQWSSIDKAKCEPYLDPFHLQKLGIQKTQKVQHAVPPIAVSIALPLPYPYTNVHFSTETNGQEWPRKKQQNPDVSTMFPRFLLTFGEWYPLVN